MSSQRYEGYLAPHVKLIKKLHAKGHSGTAIARHLLDIGIEQPLWWSGGYEHDSRVQSLAALVRYILRGPSKREKPVKWQVWTPEMQEAEFQSEYARR